MKRIYPLWLSLLLASCLVPAKEPVASTPQVQRVNLNPTSKGPKPTDIKKGSIATRFDLGQALKPSDFRVLQAFNLADIEKAVVTVASSQAEQPATAELTRVDIGSGWVFVFRGIPEGNASVSLAMLDKQGQALFRETREVLVQPGAVTPVDFTLELANPATGCTAGQCTGSIKVSVKAVTQCVGLARLPGEARVNSPVLLNVDSIEGNVERFSVDFGDGTPMQTVAALPLSHTYAQAGTYKVVTTLDGEGCKSPFAMTSYINVASF